MALLYLGTSNVYINDTLDIVIYTFQFSRAHRRDVIHWYNLFISHVFIASTPHVFVDVFKTLTQI